MKLFNVDRDVSVVEDVRRSIEALGHSLTSVNLAPNSWIMELPRVMTWGSYEGNPWTYPPALCRREHPECQDYDAFLVSNPPAAAMIFDEFEKPVVVYIHTRFDSMTMESRKQYFTLVEWMKTRAREGRLHLAASSLYDLEYTRYFTGLTPTYIPSACGYTGATYVGDDPRVLLWETRSNVDPFLLEQVPGLVPLRALYPRYAWTDIARHRAIVHVPYTASYMSFTEHYMMGIPVFVPGQEYMLRLIAKYGAGRELTPEACTSGEPEALWKARHDARPTPAAYTDLDAIRYWMRYWDMYVLPDVIFFDSPRDLSEKLALLDLGKISEGIRVVAARRKADILSRWRNFMGKVEVKLPKPA